MLIVENGRSSAAAAVHIHDLLEELVPWIERLSFLVSGIATVLPDEQHTVDGEFAAAQRERLSDGGIDLHRRKASCALPAQIVCAHLIDVQGNEIHRRMMVAALPSIALQKSIDNVLGM